MCLLQEDPVAGHNSFVEREPRLGTVPVGEVPNGRSYDRRELGDVRLLRTAVFDCSKSGNRSMVLGVRLRFGIAMPPFCGNLRRDGRDVDWPQAVTFTVLIRLGASKYNGRNRSPGDTTRHIRLPTGCWGSQPMSLQCGWQSSTRVLRVPEPARRDPRKTGAAPSFLHRSYRRAGYGS